MTTEGGINSNYAFPQSLIPMRSINFLLLLCLFSCSIGSPHHTNVGVNAENVISSPDHLAVKNNQLVDQMGNPIVLRGISYGWHNWWPRFYNAETVATFKKDWNVNLVRAAMGVEPEGAYLEKREWSKEKIQAVVNAAIEEDIYVIIDWHSHNIYLEEAKAFFSEMAQLYGNKPNVIYEIFNEPEKQSWEEVKAYSIEVIKAIREHDPDNIILIGSPNWCQDIHIVADDPIEGFDNLMYTLHFYAGTHKEWLRERADYALSKNIPLFISECASMDASGDGEIDEASWKEWLNWMTINNLSWALWSVADKDETCSMFYKTADDLGPWPNQDIKPWGIMAKETLKK